MRSRSLSGWCILLAVLAAGCDPAQVAKQVTSVLDTPESQMEKMIGCEESFLDLLASVNSEQTAQEAVPKANELAQRFDEHADRFIVLAQNKPPDGKKFRDLFDPRIKNTTERYQQEARRILEDPALRAHLPALSAKFKDAQLDFQQRMRLVQLGTKMDANGQPIATGPPPPPPASSLPPPPPPATVSSPAPARSARPKSQPTPAAVSGERAEVPAEVSPARKRAEEARERMLAGLPPFGPGGSGGRLNAPRTDAGQADAVTIVLLRRPADGGTRLSEMIRSLDKFNSFSSKTTQSSFRMTVAPVGDVREFAKKLTWAEVKSVDEDGRTITIEIDPAKLP